jgi:hypothetical protein
MVVRFAFDFDEGTQSVGLDRRRASHSVVQYRGAVDRQDCSSRHVGECIDTGEFDGVTGGE